MDQYVTGAMIKRLREEKGLSQQRLAERLAVTDKAVSKWETGSGYPDITLIEPLAAALGVSVIELFSGEDIINTNKAFNMSRISFYVCPVCGNVIQAAGKAVISCCGITLPALEAELPDSEHTVRVEVVEDEYFVMAEHEMTKEHYISFLAALSDEGVQLIKLYSEGNAQTRFKINGVRQIFAYCNRHGLFRLKIR